ncbi:hypothetical protein MGH68_07360 [Erysipelothrix sp. D19-032]
MINNHIKKLESDLENLNPKLTELNEVVESEQLKLSEAINNRNFIKNQVDVLNDEIAYWKTVQERTNELNGESTTLDVENDIREQL